MLRHQDFFKKIREKEFSRLDENGQVYLDFTGGNLYPKSIILEHQMSLLDSVLGNPHSTNPSSKLATQKVEEARDKVLSFFNASEDYFCVFTQNASNALKIVGESYPFSENSFFLLTSDNHNSVNGIREFCIKKGGEFQYVPLRYEDLRIDDEALSEQLNTKKNTDHRLFAFPAQSNVTGVKHDLNWIKIAQEKGWDVLLDAAAFVPTNSLDLQQYQPDFVSISFYKIFGYPTGIGCLLVKKDQFNKLQKPWFAGGTVSLASVKSPKHFLQNNHERFEDGTINYLSIPAIKSGLEFIEEIQISKINEHVTDLRQAFYEEISKLKHSNGLALAQLFGPKNHENVGGTIIMTFQNKNGIKYRFEEIENQANQHHISIRSGCFCNPGIDEINNHISDEELSNYYSHSEKGDYMEMVNFLGKMRGATRVSVGIATVQKDLDRFIDFLKGLLE